jgi:protein-tyrosine phosphatase
MRTEIIEAGHTKVYDKELARAADALRDGAVVIFPTETVYGIGANALNADAMRRLRELKGRSDKKPFSVHLGTRFDAAKYVALPSPLLLRFARKAWPGPLTIVAVTDEAQTPIASDCDAEQLAELYQDHRVGLRCPDHDVAAALLSVAGVPVVASSANQAGKPPPREFAEARAAFDGEVEFAVDAGPADLGVSSTVIEVDGLNWKLLREGRYDERTLIRLARSEIVFVCTGNSCRSPMAERLFRKMLSERLGRSLAELEHDGYFISSGGVAAVAGGRASPEALAELRRRGIDASDHRTSPISVERLLSAERIYAMTPQHLAAIRDLAPGVDHKAFLLDEQGAISDPVGGPESVYTHCAEQIEKAVALRLEEYLDANSDW